MVAEASAILIPPWAVMAAQTGLDRVERSSRRVRYLRVSVSGICQGGTPGACWDDTATPATDLRTNTSSAALQT